MKFKLLALASILFGALFVMPVMGITDNFDGRYAVGGELLPVSLAPFLFNPVTLVILALVILVAGGALLTGKISIEVVPE